MSTHDDVSPIKESGDADPTRSAFDAIVAAEWDEPVRCDMSTGAGGPCGHPAEWTLDCHGCSSGPICRRHLTVWRDQMAAAIARDGGCSRCNRCGRLFASVEAAGKATRLYGPKLVPTDPEQAPPAVVEQPRRQATKADQTTVDLVGRYETQLRGAARSDRWIRESVWTLRRLERSAGKPVGSCVGQDVSDFLAGLEVSAGAISTYFRHINSFYNWWESQGGTKVTAALPKPREPRGEPAPVSDDELERLLSTRMHHRTRVMVLLAAFAGLRVHEIAKFCGEGVNLGRGVLTVLGKGGLTATVPLHPLLIEAAATMPPRGYWFPANSTRPGMPIRGKSVSRIIANAMSRAGHRRRPPRLRHWYGTALLETGSDLRTVQTLLDATSAAPRAADLRGNGRQAGRGTVDQHRAARRRPRLVAVATTCLLHMQPRSLCRP